MKGILKKIELKEYSTKDGKKKFKKVEFMCDVIYKDGTVKSLKGSYSEDFAKKYFGYCNVKTAELIGKEVECVISKKAYENDKGQTITYEFIRFLNVIDENGKAIIMPSESTNEPLSF